MGHYITSDQCASFNVDFVISMLLLLVVLGSLASITEGRIKTVQQGEEAVEARLLSEKITQAMEETYSGGEGHEMVVNMPSNLAGSDYLVQVNQSGVLVKVGGRYGHSFSYFKTISNFDRSQHEVILLPGRSYTIRNVKDSNNRYRLVIS